MAALIDRPRLTLRLERSTLTDSVLGCWAVTDDAAIDGIATALGVAFEYSAGQPSISPGSTESAFIVGATPRPRLALVFEPASLSDLRLCCWNLQRDDECGDSLGSALAYLQSYEPQGSDIGPLAASGLSVSNGAAALARAVAFIASGSSVSAGLAFLGRAVALLASGLSVSDALATLAIEDNPRLIFGADLAGWWHGASYVPTAGKVSAAPDASGNALDLLQPTAGQRPTYSAADPLRGLPAIVQADATQIGLFSAGSPIAIGDKPALFVVAARGAGAANLANNLVLWDAGFVSLGMQVLINRTSGGFFGYNVAATGILGGKNSNTALDTDVPHLGVLCIDPASTHWTEFVDGTIGVVQASGPGVLAAQPGIQLVGDTQSASAPTAHCWGGTIWDAWLSRVPPTQAQLNRALAYAAAHYL